MHQRFSSCYPPRILLRSAVLTYPFRPCCALRLHHFSFATRTAATDAQRAQAKVVQTLTLELEDARKAQQKAEQSAAQAAASAAALVASSDSGRPRVILEGNALRTPTTAWRGAVHGFDNGGGAGAGGGFGGSGGGGGNSGSHASSPGSTSNSVPG